MERLEKEGKDVPNYLKNVLTRYEQLAEEAQGFIEEHDLKNIHEIRQAAVRYALNNPHVHTVCATCNTFEEAEAFLSLSGNPFTPQDGLTLAAYEQGCGIFYCRHACGLCEASCPHHVPVNSIMRYNHYFVAQHREKHAMLKYSALPKAKADKCFNCEGYCEVACPFNVPIHSLLTKAHNRLAFV